GRRDSGGEESIEVRRYLDAVRRNIPLIIAIVVVITGAVTAISLNLPLTYQAQSKIVFQETTSALGQSDAESIKRRLATTQQLLTTPQVLDAAGEELGVEGDSLGGSIKSSIDANANILIVVGEAEKPERAAAIANAVTDAFLAERAELDRLRISGARQSVQEQIDQLSTSPDGAAQIAGLRQRLSDLGVAESAAGADLQIAERAETPSSATSPRPVRNAILALFGSIFLGILVALARDQLAPRLGGARELSRILELPVLAGVPIAKRRRRARKAQILSGVEDEAYQTLRATLEFSVSGGRERVILITGGRHGEGKTTVTARLGRALTRAGHNTLVVSADLRVPKLHEEFGLPLGVGLADILTVLDSEGETNIAPELLGSAINVAVAPQRGKRSSSYLHVITSGTKSQTPDLLVTGEAMRIFLREVRRMDYDYILVDAPPLLGLADSQVVARWADTMLIVARLTLITIDQASELREVLDRLETPALGLVVIGVQSDTSPYYLASRPALVSGEPGAPT
ncbi:MAG: AAA family ATPase, partial [Solirubrobacteraceae bacterium]